jgi:hypothetical protein
MLEKSFTEVFDLNLFTENTLLIDEKIGQCCDFMLLELVKHLKYSIFQWNDSGEHLKKAFSKYNLNAEVKSIYSQDFITGYENTLINDDVFTEKRLGFNIKSKIGVFRSGSVSNLDYFDYDLVMIIERLQSGCTSKLDGNIKIVKRDQALKEVKYKIFTDKIVYFE